MTSNQKAARLAARELDQGPVSARPARVHYRRKGPHLFAIVRVPAGSSQYLRVVEKVDSRKIAEHMRKNPAVAGRLCEPSHGVGSAVRRLTRLSALLQAVKKARASLRLPGVRRLVPEPDQVDAQLRAAAQVATSQAAAARSARAAVVTEKAQQMARKRTPSGRLARSALRIAGCRV